jgi:hypothetical protein
MAALTRSLDSWTAVSGKPTIVMVGILPNMIWQYPFPLPAFYHKLKDCAIARVLDFTHK